MAAPFVPQVGAHRITLTLAVLARAAAVLFLVSGASKARALAALLAPGLVPVPAALVRPEDGDLLVLADRASAGTLAERAELW